MSQQVFVTTQIEPSIWQITDVLDDRAYLLVGESTAVLVDTCAGYGNIAQTVRELTQLPVTVLLTHSHYDHVGGTYFFEEVRISPDDDGQGEYETGLATKAHKTLVERGQFDPNIAFGPHDGSAPRIAHVRDGDVFDLGGLTVEAVALPGHTPGSMGYLVRERHVLLSGDAVTPIMCLFFERSLGITTYRQTLAKMQTLPFDRFYTGHHGVAFTQDDLPGFDACAEFALTDRGMPWMHAVLPEFVGTLHFAPCDTDDVDSPDFRALIGPYVPRESRGHRQRRRQKKD